MELARKSVLLIPRGCYHLLVPSEGAPFRRLKLAFSWQEPYASAAACFPTEVQVLDGGTRLAALAQEMCEALLQEGDACRLTLSLYGAFLLLLSRLDMRLNKPCEKDAAGRLATRAVALVERDLFAPLSLADVARALYVSPSTLSHAFKRELGIPFARYVSGKRLICAHERIAAGEAPSAVAHACGYAEYSAFYHAFFKMFGYPPTGEKKEESV